MSNEPCEKCGRVKYGDHGKTCYACEGTTSFMKQQQTTIAGERTQCGDSQDHSEQQSGLECGGMLFNGKTADEWSHQYELMRRDFGRVLGEKHELEARYMGNPEPTRSHEPEAERESVLSSRFKIGDRVKLTVIQTCPIFGFVKEIIFTDSKVLYSLWIAEAETTLHNVDSVYVEQ
jgi:hypothetical protein